MHTQTSSGQATVRRGWLQKQAPLPMGARVTGCTLCSLVVRVVTGGTGEARSFGIVRLERASSARRAAGHNNKVGGGGTLAGTEQGNWACRRVDTPCVQTPGGCNGAREALGACVDAAS